MENPASTTSRGTSKDVLSSRRLFSRDLNYLRDAAILWPFVISSIAAVTWVFSPSSRQMALRCAGLAIAAILLAKEKFLIFIGALGFCALQGALWLVIRPWSWSMFAVTALTGIPFLIANRFWRKPKLAYEWPDELGAVDVLWGFASICGTLYLLFLISPHKWGVQ